MSEHDAQIQELRAYIEDLEVNSRHLYTVVIGVLERGPIPPGCHYALLALSYRFTCAQDEMITDFLNWVYVKRGIEDVTRDEVLVEWHARAPEPLRNKLMAVIKAQAADGACTELARILGL